MSKIERRKVRCDSLKSKVPGRTKRDDGVVPRRTQDKMKRVPELKDCLRLN